MYLCRVELKNSNIQVITTYDMMFLGDDFLKNGITESKNIALKKSIVYS